MKNIITTAAIFAICLLALSFCSNKTECKQCVEYQTYISELLHRIKTDKPEYYEELSETDLWIHLDELLEEPIPVIEDSIYRKLRTVFPDLPPKQALPDTKPTW